MTAVGQQPAVPPHYLHVGGPTEAFSLRKELTYGGRAMGRQSEVWRFLRASEDCPRGDARP